MRRRELIAAVAGAVAVGRAALAEQPIMPTIGVLLTRSQERAVRFFREGLRDRGYVEGRNLRLEIRSADGNVERLPGLAAELVGAKVDLLAVLATPAALAAKQATSEIPIVMLSVGDPVASGLVASLARPGGNITGMGALNTENAGKVVELLGETVPNLVRLAALLNAADPFSEQQLQEIRRAGGALKIEVVPFMVKAGPEVDAAFAAMADQKVGAVFVQGSLPLKEVADLAVRHRLPAGAAAGFFAREGGLLGYSASGAEIFRRAAVFADKILKGAKPADLPVEQPTRFNLIINLKTAKALDLTLPRSILVRADEIIE